MNRLGSEKEAGSKKFLTKRKVDPKKAGGGVKERGGGDKESGRCERVLVLRPPCQNKVRSHEQRDHFTPCASTPPRTSGPSSSLFLQTASQAEAA